MTLIRPRGDGVFIYAGHPGGCMSKELDRRSFLKITGTSIGAGALYQAGAAMAYGHCVVSQSPIDVNISKQMSILLTNMDLKREQIVIDPLTGAMGYGIEYSYSVMERIRLTGLNGDAMLALPMIVSPGQECAKIKELRASE